MALQGFSISDIDYTQINAVMDIADKKVNANKSPIGITMNLSLSDSSNKVVAIQRLLSELDKRNLFGKVDFNFTDTKFSSEEIEKITRMMDSYKDKPINFSFDTNANKFSKQDTVNILKAVNGSKSTVYPFSSMTNDGLSPELRQQFLENNPNIIQTSGNNPNLKQLKRILGFSTNDIRGEIVDGANNRKISASEYANYIASSMDMSKIQELQKYSSAIERLSMDYSALSLGNLQKNGYDDENVFFQTIKNVLDRRIQTAENEKNQENTRQATSNNTQSHEQQSVDNPSSESQKDENKMNFEDLQNKYYDHISNNTGSAEELWNMANHLEQNDKSGEYTKYAPYAIVDRDPTFKPQTMFNIIANNANEGYASDFDNDPSGEIEAYITDVRALASLAEHNLDLSSSSRLLSTLNNISKETVACYQESKAYDKETSTYFSMFALNVIPAYAKCEYNTPKQAEAALQNIANITKNLDTYARNPHDVIYTVHSIVNNSDSDKDVATSVFSAVHLVSPQNFEEASKLLSLYKTISLDNPELAEASISKMHKIFNDFPHDEKLQKECLSTLESLNGFRSKFDEDAQKKLDIHSKSMKSKIDAETIKKAQGKETTWKSPVTSNSQRSSVNTQSNFNYNNTYKGR